MDTREALSRVNAREIVRSLSNGVVPPRGCWRFSHGRQLWLEALGTDMEDVAADDGVMPVVRIANGRNGDGKTHLMHVLRHLAFQHGLAVAYVVISSDVPLHRWDRVYQEIARTITTPSGAQGFTRILDPRKPAREVLQDFQHKAMGVRRITGLDADFATAVYRYTTQQTTGVDREGDMHSLAAWLEGYATGSMRQFNINSRIDRVNGAAILRSLVRVLRNFGLPGVLIMVDEVESILGLSKSERDKSYQTLRLLVDGSNLSEHTLVIASTTPPMYTDLERGLQTYPALWSRIKPDDHGTEVNYFATIVDLTKATLSASDFLGIARSIAEIYEIAWNLSATSWASIEELASEASEIAASGELTMTFSAPRVFVKLIVDMLDQARAGRDIDEAYSNMRRAFGAADRALADLDAKSLAAAIPE
jgi:hypothetical protein